MNSVTRGQCRLLTDLKAKPEKLLSFVVVHLACLKSDNTMWIPPWVALGGQKAVWLAARQSSTDGEESLATIQLGADDALKNI